VLDASAFLAVANREPGAERVYSLLPDAVLSVVNAAEVLQKLGQRGMTIQKADEYVRRFVGEIAPFDYQQAAIVSSLFVGTQPLGLSFCARACLALGKTLDVPVLTADATWLKLDLGIKIETIQTAPTIELATGTGQ
jgi:PIN domain nuclease of toxin-antitoxin system